MKIENRVLGIMSNFDFGMHLIYTPLFEHAIMGGDFGSATEKVENK